MRKLRLALIFVAAVMMLITVTSCGKKTTEPDVSAGKMIFVPGGTFTMGDTKNLEFYGAQPTHTVTLNPFYIGKYEVTQAEYTKYMQPKHHWIDLYGLGARYPAYGISWYAAIKYCNLRSIAEGLTPCYTISESTNPADWGEVPDDYNHPGIRTWDIVTCDFAANGYRLPTEAEWEYAARGATNVPDYRYSGSDNIDAVAWYDNQTIGADHEELKTHPAAKKAPNALGIYDMSGNVGEWCWDWFDANYYARSPENNPTGPVRGRDLRVTRGGYWFADAWKCIVFYRGNEFTSSNDAALGFRLCRSKID
jgi:formylglycine-generating enzyme required for sulfatase activity